MFQNPLVTIGETEAEVNNTEVDSDAVCAYYEGIPDEEHRFNCTQSMYGRYVRITLLAYTKLLLFEVEVIGIDEDVFVY